MRIDGLAAATRAYFDSNVFIYLVEGREGLQELASLALDQAKHGGVEMVASELALAECLVGAYRLEDEDLAGEYRSLLAPSEKFLLAPVGWSVLNLAAEIGPRSGLRLLDAIHVATALRTNCDVFVTNDAGIRQRADINVVQLA